MHSWKKEREWIEKTGLEKEGQRKAVQDRARGLTEGSRLNVKVRQESLDL